MKIRRQHSPRVLFTHREMDSITLHLAQYLASKAHWEVYVTAECKPSQKVEPSPWQEGGITYLPLSPITSKCSWPAICQLRRYDSCYRFDLIYSVGSSGLSNALLATLGRRGKHIGYRGTGARVRRWDPTYYLGVLNPRVTHLICETEHIRSYMEHFIPPSKLSVHTKPFALEWTQEAAREPLHPKADRPISLRLVSVANTLGRPYKGLTTLVEAINLIADPSLSLVLVGDYSEADYALAMRGPVPECFHFVGPSSEAMRYIAGAEVYVLPSYRDASPRVLREAMALGLPTIVSNIPGSRDLIVPGYTGLLAEPRDPTDLARQICWMQEHPEERRLMGERSREHLEQHYALEPYLQGLHQLFASILGVELDESSPSILSSSVSP